MKFFLLAPREVRQLARQSVDHFQALFVTISVQYKCALRGNVVGHERVENSGFDSRIIYCHPTYLWRDFLSLLLRRRRRPLSCHRLVQISKMLQKVIGHMLRFHTGRCRLVGRHRFTILAAAVTAAADVRLVVVP